MNNMKNFIVLLIFFIVSLLGGCTSSQFNKEYDSFKTSYLKVTEVLDVREPFVSIEKLTKDPIKKELDDMQSLVTKMNKESLSNSEKRMFDNVSQYYNGLKFLLYAANNKDKLSEDERGRIATELTLMSMHRSSIKRGDI
jgi:hypothetical protein